MSTLIEELSKLRGVVESVAEKIREAINLAPQNDESQNVARIDWRKAPEGATHFCPARKTWLKQGAHCTWLSWSPFGRINEDVLIGWTFCHPPENRSSLLTKEWNGEGFPPAGTVCEMTTNNGHNWREVKIVFFDDYVALIGQPKGQVNRELFKRCDADVAFRPIRTPDQIAADERESHVNGMLCYDALGGTRRGLAEALYDAGYRKP